MTSNNQSHHTTNHAAVPHEQDIIFAQGPLIIPGSEDHPAPPFSPPAGAGCAGKAPSWPAATGAGPAHGLAAACANNTTTPPTKGLEEAVPITSYALLPRPAQPPPPRGWSAHGRQAHGESCGQLPFTVSEVPKPREMGNLKNKTNNFGP